MALLQFRKVELSDWINLIKTNTTDPNTRYTLTRENRIVGEAVGDTLVASGDYLEIFTSDTNKTINDLLYIKNLKLRFVLIGWSGGSLLSYFNDQRVVSFARGNMPPNTPANGSEDITEHFELEVSGTYHNVAFQMEDTVHEQLKGKWFRFKVNADRASGGLRSNLKITVTGAITGNTGDVGNNSYGAMGKVYFAV